MTLDEAIKRAEEVIVESLEKTEGRNASDPIAIKCGERAEEHRQLAEWLKELKQLREQTMEKEIIDSLPTVNVVIPNNATNGDVIQALFPNIDKGFSNVIDLNLWWNAKCKAEIDIIDELEKIKAEIDYCRKKHNCGVSECFDVIDKEVKAARLNRWRKGE